MKHSDGGTTRRKFLQAGAGAGLLSRTPAVAASRRAGYRTFSEGRIGKLRLKNRLVRAAAAEGACPDGRMTEAGLDIYRRLASGGVGLIITGHMTVMREGRAERTQTCVYDDSFTDAIGRIAAVVHARGNDCKVVAEISHAGMQSRICEPVGPTSRPWPRRGKLKPRALTTREVQDIISHYAQAARRVKEAGFDGVEIHCAHGYLLSSFLSPYTNTRTDAYGGSLAKRTRIVREIIEQARALVGQDFPILVKMNCDDGVEGGINIDTFPALAKEIEKTGIQALEVSGHNPCRMGISGPEQESYFLNYARRLDLDIPVILTGGNRSIERLEKIANSGGPDFFAMARPLIREPDLPNRWLEGRGGDESTCISCNRCLMALGKGEPTRCRVDELGG